MNLRASPITLSQCRPTLRSRVRETTLLCAAIGDFVEDFAASQKRPTLENELPEAPLIPSQNTTGGGRRWVNPPARAGFSLVEVSLAIAVVAIGLVGIMAVFPLGLDATRTAADSTQMASFVQDSIGYYQQMAVNTNLYSTTTTPAQGLNWVIDNGIDTTNALVDGIWYTSQAWRANSGYTSIYCAGPPSTNMITRITIGVWRTLGPPNYKAITRTNYYVTEVARYGY